jgi:hypothetical protein
MIESAPDYYQGAASYEAIQEAKAQELDDLEFKIKDLQLQLNPATATWGLKYYEKELGLSVDPRKSLDERRSNIISRKRGFGNFSADLIKSVARSYTNGEVDVKVTPATFDIQIKFVSATGVPPNLGDFKAAIDNIVHAHMDVTYVYRYLTINEVQALTLSQLDGTQLTNFAPFLENLT